MESKQLIKKYVGFKDYDEYKAHKVQRVLNREIFGNKSLLEEQRDVLKNYIKTLPNIIHNQNYIQS